MIELMTAMPDGTIGLRVSGRLTREDFRGVVPVLRQAAESGEVRIVEVIGPDYEGLEPGAVIEDLKVGLEFLVGHRSALKRTAIVTDAAWIRRAIHAFVWMVPGEVQIFELDELEEAKGWAAD
jgi:hypothetical protein